MGKKGGSSLAENTYWNIIETQLYSRYTGKLKVNIYETRSD